ncbi:uncharacterized GPI-anchored protein At4g28100-like [Dioscorea cayenensis subsp. rotundata]|uniref:Uncharacterized GPI-anchored protein At4g28100-like n=1 Tax=Dioscorea cayennensis subsp. rotundata TaxID=55577 RepID=A0AB40CYB1_DIOCR|nr:uncharacterized GPI-anchored protein At4g28100-like [Dioscorea cayenensis subsp. rotundata]
MSTTASMLPLLLHLLLLLRLAIAAIPNPDPALIHPSLLFPSASAPPSTIPAFPEQSDAAASTTTTCPLDLSPSLLHAISHSCSSSSSSLPSRSRCCPTLAAWLLSAYASTALRAPPPQPLSDLPVLPDDSESCADGAEAAIRSRGVSLPRVNGTCGIAYCYCGVRLRRLTCPSAFSASGDQSRWSPKPAVKKKLEKDCNRAGIAGCSRCLSTLNQLSSMAGGGNATKSGKKPASHEAKPDDGECQMMGLTWLLSRNRTLYLPTATAVLRSFLATAPGTGAPTSCSLPHDDMPLAVDSSQLDGSSSSAPSLPLSHHSPLFSPLINLLVLFGVFVFA